MQPPQTKICLIGGTFDPIHLGHTYIALTAKNALSLDKVIFLPCRKSPHKLDRESTPDQQRLEMCQLATASYPWAEVSDYDLKAPPPSYSWRTAEHFKTLYPEAELYWLMGTDQWNALPKWERAEYFAQLVTIIVFERDLTANVLTGFDHLPLSGHHPAAATSIRNDFKNGRVARWLHPDVSAYIKEKQLYTK